jgi:hypothetical protein
MKKLVNRITQTSIAMVIFCIVVYGIVYAQQACCSTIVDTCIPASNRTSVKCFIDNSYRTFPSYHWNNHLQPNGCSKNPLANFDPGNTCCKADRCDNYNQVTYFSLSFVQDFFPLQKNVSSLDEGNNEPTTFKLINQPTVLSSIPIYIMTQSIIC